MLFVRVAARQHELHQHLSLACLSRNGREGEPCMAPLIEPQRRGQREEGAAAGLQLQGSASDTAAASNAATATGAAAASDDVQAAYPVVPAGQPPPFCVPRACDPLHVFAHRKCGQAEANPRHSAHGVLFDLLIAVERRAACITLPGQYCGTLNCCFLLPLRPQGVARGRHPQRPAADSLPAADPGVAAERVSCQTCSLQHVAAEA